MVRPSFLLSLSPLKSNPPSAVCRPWKRWPNSLIYGERSAPLPGLDLRTRTSHGYSPERIVAQLLYAFCSGGSRLADAERL